MTMTAIATQEGRTALVEQGSWGARSVGTHAWTMTLFAGDTNDYACIEWDIPALETTTEIGLWFDADGSLSDYDGVMELPAEAAELIRSAGRGWTVDPEML